MTPELWRVAGERLAAGWSPEQISGRFKKEGEPMAGRQWIQRHVHADRKAGGRLWRHLWRRGFSRSSAAFNKAIPISLAF